MNIENTIKQAMAKMIQRQRGLVDVVVIEWEEEFNQGGFNGCDTCGYGADEDTYNVAIRYVTPNQQIQIFDCTGSFVELIRELDKE